MNHSRYQQAFALFLKRTDEKQVLVPIIRRFGRLTVQSRVLDIGAGSGDIARAIAPSVGAYVAVEPNRGFATRLRRLPVTALAQTWQRACPQGLFDCIIASHVLTYFPDRQLFPLLSKMHALLAPHGRLLIMTVDQTRGSWRTLHSFLYRRQGIRKRKTSVLIERWLRPLHPVVRHFSTTVKPQSFRELLLMLEFDFPSILHTSKSTRRALEKFCQRFFRHNGLTLSMVHQLLIFQK